jgi:CrcB protein
MLRWLILMLGGALGTLTRYGLSSWVSAQFGTGFPYGTLAVNLLGCWLIGLLAGLPSGTASLAPTLRLFLVIGFLGGLTTFSAYALESFLLLRQGALLSGLLNLLGSMAAGLLALLIGFFTMKSLLVWRA